MKLIEIQRSKGYAIRKSISLSKVENVIKKINLGEGPYYIEGYIYPIRYKNSSCKKFSNEQINLIISDLLNTHKTQEEIAIKFGCGRKLISQINTGKKYYIEVYSYPIR